jgi:hypothetical protein
MADEWHKTQEIVYVGVSEAEYLARQNAELSNSKSRSQPSH